MEHRLPVKVYYEDTDCLGVVYHANYLKYFERARTEMIDQQGRPISEWNAEGFNFVVYKLTVTFHKPAKLGELCEVRTTAQLSTPYRMKMIQRLFRTDELITEAEVQLVCIDGEGGLREFPDVL